MTTNLFKFIDKLPEEYGEKEDVRQKIQNLPLAQQDMSIAEYGRRLE